MSIYVVGGACVAVNCSGTPRGDNAGVMYAVFLLVLLVFLLFLLVKWAMGKYRRHAERDQR